LGGRNCITAWVIALFALSGCKGCHGRTVDSRPTLGKVVITRASAATVRGTSVILDDTRIATQVKVMLGAADIFATDAGGGEMRSRADVDLALEVLADSEAVDAEVGVKIRLKIEMHPATAATNRYAESTAAVGQAPLAKGATSDLVAAFQRLAERTTEDLLRGYTARQKLWSAAEGEIAKGLSSDDGDVRLEAIRIAGARKLKGQLPAVIRLLSDRDEATRDAALGAVVAMGERGAIKALADSRQMRDSYEMGKVVDAVASLGGPEAKDYLSFVAENHDDPDIRKMAQAALDRLMKRKVTGASTK